MTFVPPDLWERKLQKLLLGFAATLLATACGASEPKQLSPDSVVKGLNYVGVVVADIEQSTAFYETANMSVVEDQTLQDSEAIDALSGRENVVVETRMLRSANAQVRLMQFSDRDMTVAAVAVQGPGIAHVCHQVAQSTQTYQNFLVAGAKVIGDPELVQLSSRNPVYYGYVEDLDGAVIEIEHVDIEKLNLPEPPKNEYRIRHVALASPDVDRIAEFYSAFLDQPDPRRIGGSGGFGGKKIDAVSGLEGSKIKMAWFQIRNIELEISQYVSHPTELPATPRPIDATGYNLIVFDVDDLDAAMSKFVDAGGTIATEPEAMDGGTIVFGRDPDGNLIGLQAAPADAIVSSKNFSGNGT